MTHRRRTHLSLRAERGQTAVEFALIAPMLIALLLGIVQGGIAFRSYIAVTDAARAAARKAVLLRVGSVTTSDVQQAAYDAAGGLKQANVGVTVSDAADPQFAHAGSTVQVTVTYPYTISILGIAVCKNCTLTSTMKDRLE
jgi:Flp pilus assembly protein TadG